MGRVTLGVRVKTICFHFGCRFGYGFGLLGLGFGSRVCFARSTYNYGTKSRFDAATLMCTLRTKLSTVQLKRLGKQFG